MIWWLAWQWFTVSSLTMQNVYLFWLLTHLPRWMATSIVRHLFIRIAQKCYEANKRSFTAATVLVILRPEWFKQWTMSFLDSDVCAAQWWKHFLCLSQGCRVLPRSENYCKIGVYLKLLKPNFNHPAWNLDFVARVYNAQQFRVQEIVGERDHTKS